MNDYGYVSFVVVIIPSFLFHDVSPNVNKSNTTCTISGTETANASVLVMRFVLFGL